MPVNGTAPQAQIQSVGGQTGFQVQTGLVTQSGYPATGPIKAAVLPYWSVGTGAPSASFQPPYGSLYTNTASAAGASSLYCFKPNATGPGTWHAII